MVNNEVYDALYYVFHSLKITNCENLSKNRLKKIIKIYLTYMMLFIFMYKIKFEI